MRDAGFRFRTKLEIMEVIESFRESQRELYASITYPYFLKKSL